MILLININNERNHIIIFRLPLSLIFLTALVSSMILIIRYYHCSWAAPSGLFLLGGAVSKRTTEKILENGTSSSSFELKYDTA